MFKNVASQYWIVFAFDRTDNTPKTGDAGNITAKIKINNAAAGASDDTNPTEIEDGYYVFTLTQAETNGDMLSILPESTTANIQVIGCPEVVFTSSVSHARAGYLDELAAANMPADLDAVLADTAVIGAAGAGLTAVPWNAAWDAEVQSEVADGLNAAMPAEPTGDSLNQYIQQLKWVLVNKMAITEADGATVGYKDDDVAEAYSVAAAFTTAAGVTTRKRLET